MRTEYIKQCANWLECDVNDYVLADRLRKCVASNDRDFIRWIGEYITKHLDEPYVGKWLIEALDEYDDTLY